VQVWTTTDRGNGAGLDDDRPVRAARRTAIRARIAARGLERGECAGVEGQLSADLEQLHRARLGAVLGSQDHLLQGRALGSSALRRHARVVPGGGELIVQDSDAIVDPARTRRVAEVHCIRPPWRQPPRPHARLALDGATDCALLVQGANPCGLAPCTDASVRCQLLKLVSTSCCAPSRSSPEGAGTRSSRVGRWGLRASRA